MDKTLYVEVLRSEWDAAQAAIEQQARGIERLSREAKNDAIAYRAVLERQNELRSDLAALRTQLASTGGEAVEYQQLSRYGNWDKIEKAVFDIGKLGDAPERFRALYTHPQPAPSGVVVDEIESKSAPEQWQDKLSRLHPTIQNGKWPKAWQEEAKLQELAELRALLNQTGGE